MGQHRPDEPSTTPEQLAAYADGELSPAARRAVEDWLAGHPEERALVESLRNLDQLCRETAPPEPSAEVWASVLARVGDAASAPPQPPRPRRRVAGLAWIALALGATAATLLLSVDLTPTPPVDSQPNGAELARRPLAFMTDEDVEIISMDAGDTNLLVVGDPPHKGAIVMAGADDVIVHQSGPDVEVIMPDRKDQGRPAWPLIMVTTEVSREP